MSVVDFDAIVGTIRVAYLCALRIGLGIVVIGCCVDPVVLLDVAGVYFFTFYFSFIYAAKFLK